MAILERLIEDLGHLTVGEAGKLKATLDAAWGEINALDAPAMTTLNTLELKTLHLAIIEAATDHSLLFDALRDPDTHIRQTAARRLREINGATPVDVPNLATLSDAEVLKLARLMMPEDDQQRWRELQEATATRDLASDEDQELQTLETAHWLGQYTKTEAMMEAIQRGLLEKRD